MQFDFTSIMDRLGRDAMAVDNLGLMDGFAPELPKAGWAIIPMWIADMNFPTAPSIPRAITERLQHTAGRNAETAWMACCRSISAMKTACLAAW